MRTIYIKGIKKYKVSLQKGLAKSELVEGEDYIAGLGGEDFDLYWINDDVELKEFKKAVGVKFVWKHRMRFFNTIEEMNPPNIESTELTAHDILFIKKIKDEIYSSL